VDVRDDETRSVFNSRRTMPAALADVLSRIRAETVILSYNDESWITAAQMADMLRDSGHEAVEVFAFDSKRYVGAQIGIHSPAGKKVGAVSHLRNTEYVFVAGGAQAVRDVAAGLADAAGGQRSRVLDRTAAALGTLSTGL